MKKCRCPNCGEKCIENFNRMLTERRRSYVGYKTDRVYDICNCCPNCNSKYLLSNSKKYIIITIIFSVIELLLLGLVCGVSNSTVRLIILILLLCTTPIFVLYILSIRAKLAILPFDTDTLDTYVPKPHTRITVNNSKYIKDYFVYALKFQEDTDSVKFKEAFPDKLIPAMFIPDQRDGLTYNIYFTNKAGVPEEFLQKGVQFLVQDNDDIFISRGTVEKPELDW